MNRQPPCILITGFGAFPGAPSNPTSALIQRLERHKARLARQNVRLELAVLPVLYEGLPAELGKLHENLRPAAILHFGLAAKRKLLSLELRAKNRLSLLHPDASGARAENSPIVPQGPDILRARFPVAALMATFNSHGLKAGLSIDAGDYICNQALYLSLSSPAPVAGFIHVPKPGRISLEELEKAALLAIGLSLKASRLLRKISP